MGEVRMSNDIKISVIIPCYNAEHYIAECLDSVLSQSLKDIEIICVNDGSTDGTLAVLQGYASQRGNMTVIDKPNGGPSSARNAGLARARGEYIQFLDSDDYFRGEALAELYQTMSANRLDVLFFDGETVCSDEALHEQFQAYDSFYTSKEAVNGVKTGKELYLALCKSGSYRVAPVMQTFRRAYLAEHDIAFYEGILYEDNLFTIKALLQADRAGHLPKPFYVRRLHHGSVVTARKNYHHVRSYMVCFMEIISFLEQRDFGPEVMACAQTRLASLYLNAKSIFDSLPLYEKEQAKAEYPDSAWINLLLNVSSGSNDSESLLRKTAVERWCQTPYDPERPFVTVVSPVYNAEAHLHETVKDLLAQSLRNFEIRFVDDGSTDSSVRIIESYAEQDPRIKLHRQQNQYAGVARNNGLDLARGEYVIFLDSDDRFDPDLLALTYHQAKTHDAEVVLFDADILQMPKEIIIKPLWLQQSKFLPLNVFAAEESKDTLFNLLNPWTKLYRRDYIQKNGFRYQPLYSTNDAHFTMMALACASRIVTLPVPLVHYRTGQTTNLQSTKARSPLDVYDAFLETKRQMQARGIYETFAVPLAAKAAESMVHGLSTLKTREARQALYTCLHDGGLEELDIRLLNAGNMTHANSRNILACCDFVQKNTFEAYERKRKKLHRQTPPSADETLRYASADALRAEIIALRGSWAYRIGSRITYFPHKIRSLLGI